MTFSTMRLESGLFIIIKAQPIQAIKNGVNGLLCGTFLICIFNPQKSASTMMTSVKPVKQRGACAANMQKTRGRGGETGDDFACHMAVIPILLRRPVEPG